MSSLMQPTSLLKGNRTIPGCELPEEVKKEVPKILDACRRFGLDFYPVIIEDLDYDEMSEVASYGGFPVRYPHWRWGMEYEEMSKGFEHSQYRIYEMVVNCLSKETVIPTANGSKKAENIKVGDVVFHRNGPRNVVAVVKQPAAKTLCLNIRGQATKTICTPNHKWEVIRENGPTWVEAKQLVIGDIILGGDTYRHFKNSPAKLDWDNSKVIAETKPNVRHCLKNINPPKEMTCELAELLGMIVGDGSQGVKGSENNVSICVGKDYPEYANHIQGLASNLFGEVLREDKGAVWNIIICSKEVVYFLDAIGLTKGCTYKNKRIPWSIWNSSNQYRAAFLKGLFDTDGSSGTSLSFSCYNPDLASDVQLMLSEMGIFSVVNHVKNDNNDINVLHVQGKSSLFKFRERINFATKHKQELLSELTDTENCMGGGVHVKFIQSEIIRISNEYGFTTYSEPSLGRSVKSMSKSEFGINALYGFVFRALLSGYEKFSPLWELINVPLYQVESIENGPVTETIDIALDHNDHDFLANGMSSHNTNPCYIYNLSSNTIVDHVTVIAHATAHNDFFKNNRMFAPTSQNMMNELANHGTRIRRYSSEWGKEKVQKFIDRVLTLSTLIDPASAYIKREYQEPLIWQKRNYREPKRIQIPESQRHLDNWVNNQERIDEEKKRIKKIEDMEEIGAMQSPERDIFRFLRDESPLKAWEKDIISMLYEEELYFSPQGATKMINEGWASFADSQIMARYGLANGDGIYEYALHKAGVLGGPNSMNPYKLGYQLFLDIEERWNKGRFGFQYDECRDYGKKKEWNTNAGLGHEKIFEVRALYNDIEMLQEFFTEDFCRENNFYEKKRMPDGSWEIVSRDFKKIKASLIRSKMNRGCPDVRIVDNDFRHKNILVLKHFFDGRTLNNEITGEALKSISSLWNHPVVLLTKDKHEKEYCLYVENDRDSTEVVRTELSKI